MLLIIVLILLLITVYLISYGKESFISGPDSKEIYLFWTGGYDSTFRLCQALIDENMIVTPIYISYKHLDNLPNKSYKRHSQPQEIAAMDKIRREILKKYPYLKDNLKPTLVIPHIDLREDITKSMYNLWKEGRNHRSLSQYGGLAQVSLDLNRDVEIAVEKSRHSTMRNMVKKYVVEYPDGKYRIKNPDKNTEIFKNMVFPTFYTSKKEMLNIAKKNNYKDILNITWSCWFPRKGKPCKKCPMCIQRII